VISEFDESSGSVQIRAISERVQNLVREHLGDSIEVVHFVGDLAAWFSRQMRTDAIFHGLREFAARNYTFDWMVPRLNIILFKIELAVTDPLPGSECAPASQDVRSRGAGRAAKVRFGRVPSSEGTEKLNEDTQHVAELIKASEFVSERLQKKAEKAATAATAASSQRTASGIPEASTVSRVSKGADSAAGDEDLNAVPFPPFPRLSGTEFTDRLLADLIGAR